MYMKNFRDFLAVCSVVSASLFLAAPGTSFGETQTKGASAKDAGPEMSRDDQIANHEKMIGMHTEMISCLKTDAPVADCHKQMMTACAEIHGGTCPMMGGMMGGMMGNGMMGKGMMGKGMMQPGNGMMSPNESATPGANDSSNPKK
jgi:hypothetical protein